MASNINYNSTNIEVKNDKMRNFRDRINFIKFWANFMKTHSDREWSEGQAMLIDGQFGMAKNFYDGLEKTEEGKEILLRLKKERLKT